MKKSIFEIAPHPTRAGYFVVREIATGKYLENIITMALCDNINWAALFINESSASLEVEIGRYPKYLEYIRLRSIDELSSPERIKLTKLENDIPEWFLDGYDTYYAPTAELALRMYKLENDTTMDVTVELV